MRKIIYLLLAAACSAFCTFNSNAATYTVIANANCSTIGGAGVPLAAADVVTVKNGATLTVDGTYTCASLTIGAGGMNGGNGTLTFNSGSQLTVSGAFTIGTAARVGTINMTNGGKLIMGVGSSFTIANAANAILTPGSGTVNIVPAIILPASFTTYNNLEANSAGTVNLGVTTICNGYVNLISGTLHTVAASNFNLTVGGAFTVATGATFISNNSVVTCQGNVTLNGTITTGAGQLIYNANFTNNGTYTIGNGTTTFNGTTVVAGTVATKPFYNVQINSGANVTLPAACTVNNNWTNNGGTVTPGTGTVTFNSATAQAINGTATTHNFYNLTVNKGGNTLTVGGSTTVLNVNTFTQSSGGFTLPATASSMYLTGDFVHALGTFTPGLSTVTFNGAGAQAISGATATTFYKLAVNKIGSTLTQSTTTVGVTSLMNMLNGTFNVGTNTLNGAGGFAATGGDLQIAKLGTEPELTGTYTIVGGTVTLNGAGAQTLRPSISYYNAVLGTSGIKTMTSITSIQNNLTISGTSTMTGNAALIIGGTLTYSSSGITTLTAATNISMGSFLQSGGTLVDNGNTLTVTGPLWSRTAGTFTATGKVDFTSTSAITLSGPAVTTFSKLFKTGSGTLTASVNSVVSSELNISSGTFDVGANSLTGAAAVNMSNGTLSIATTGTTVPALSGAYALTGGTVLLNAAGSQIVRAVNYYNLDLTSGTKTFDAGTTGIAAALTLNSSPTVNLRTNSTTLSYNGTGSYLNQTIAALNYHNLNFGSISGIKTFPSGTTMISGAITTSGATGDALTNSTIIEFDGTAAQAITGSAIPSYYDITNSNTAGLTSTGSISLFNTMTLSANSIYTNSGTLTFKSDITSTARLAEVPASAVFNGNISMQKLVPAITPSAGTNYFHIMGSPVAGSVFSAVAYDETNTGTIDAGFPCTTCLTALSVGQGGFRNLGANEILFNYPSSPPNIGTKVVNTSFTASANSLDDGWNLVSNPYPCEIFWSGATLSNVAGTAYLWNGANYDEYLQADGLSIPSGQGFWVKSTGGGSVTFHESDKVVDDNPIFLRQASTPDYPKMVLKISGNGSFDLADVRFNADATAGFDPIYDAYKLNGNTNVPRLSSYNSANEEMSINSMPELNQNYDIPMVARCIQSGAYQISVESLSGFPSSACIFLEDLVTGSFYDLRSTSIFDITLVGSSISTTRFILHIGAPVSIQVTDASCNNGDYTGSILAQGQANGPWTYTWQDAAGNVIHTATNSIGADSITNVPSGSYTLLIQNSTGNCTSTSEDITLGGFAPIDANALIASPTCFGDANGSIQLNAAGGNGTLTIQWDNLSSSDPSINNLTAGTYPLTISDAAGCSHHETFELTQPAEIMAACTASSNLLYLSNGGWVSFTNQSTGATSYRWNFGDGSAEYTGNTAAHQYTTAGAYTVTLTAINGTCESSFSIEIQVEQAPTGLVNQTQNEELQINAANGIIHCHFNFATEQVVTIAITNMLGQEVYAIKEYAAYNNTLDIKPQGSANGVYLVHLSYAGHLQTKKIFLDK